MAELCRCGKPYTEVIRDGDLAFVGCLECGGSPQLDWTQTDAPDPLEEERLARLRSSRQRAVELGQTAKTIQPLPKTFASAIVGVTFVRHDDGSPAYPENVQLLERLAGIKLWRDDPEPIAAVLIPCPDNPADPNAIEVHVPAVGGNERLRIGFLPRALAAKLSPLLAVGYRYRATVVEVKTSPHHPDKPGVLVGLERAVDPTRPE